MDNNINIKITADGNQARRELVDVRRESERLSTETTSGLNKVSSTAKSATAAAADGVSKLGQQLGLSTTAAQGLKTALSALGNVGWAAAITIALTALTALIKAVSDDFKKAREAAGKLEETKFNNMIAQGERIERVWKNALDAINKVKSTTETNRDVEDIQNTSTESEADINKRLARSEILLNTPDKDAQDKLKKQWALEDEIEKIRNGKSNLNSQRIGEDINLKNDEISMNEKVVKNLESQTQDKLKQAIQFLNEDIAAATALANEKDAAAEQAKYISDRSDAGYRINEDYQNSSQYKKNKATADMLRERISERMAQRDELISQLADSNFDVNSHISREQRKIIGGEEHYLENDKFKNAVDARVKAALDSVSTLGGARSTLDESRNDLRKLEAEKAAADKASAAIDKKVKALENEANAEELALRKKEFEKNKEAGLKDFDNQLKDAKSNLNSKQKELETLLGLQSGMKAYDTDIQDIFGSIGGQSGRIDLGSIASSIRNQDPTVQLNNKVQQVKDELHTIAGYVKTIEQNKSELASASFAE